jgi:low molecular weight phosphotyrosine protein phosphatase
MTTNSRAVFAHTVEQMNKSDRFHVIDSFGTGAYHVGENPDRRSAKTCREHGVAISHKAQQIWPHHFEKFDYIIAMDDSNYEDLVDMKPKNSRAKVHLFGEFGTNPKFSKQIDDPYYGGLNGFEKAFEQVSHFSEGLLKHIIEV